MRIVAHGGDRIAAALRAQGVSFIFTLCGGHISPILTACKSRGIRVVDCRHEATVLFAADAAARLTGIPGVAVVTAGPGITNTITALKNAQLAQSPVVLLGGAAPTALQGRGALQDIDQQALVMPHVKFFKRIKRAADLGLAIREAFGIVQQGLPGPAFLECSVDLLYPEEIVRRWYSEASAKSQSLSARILRWYLKRHVNRLFAYGEGTDETPIATAPVLDPPESSVKAASQALARAQRPILVIGSQAVAVPGECEATAVAAAKVGVPIFLTGMARGLLGREHPLQMRHHRRDALRESDCVILAGVPCDFRLDYGRQIKRQTTLISANRSAQHARMNRRPAIAAIGDVGRFLQELAGQAPGRQSLWEGWIEKLRERGLQRETEIDGRARIDGEFVNPIRLFRELDHAMGNNVVVVADGGDFVATASYIIRPRGPLSWLDPGVFGTLGVGAGFALGAGLARPGCEIWSILGDGASGYGLVELDTFVRHRIPVIAIVGNDASWSQIAREQIKLLHDDVGTVLGRTDYHKVAEAFGAVGLLVKKNADIAQTLAQAKECAAAGKPVLVNVWLDKSDFREGALSL